MTSLALQDGLFTSPTNSEFSDVYDGLDSVRAWDEKKVGEWLQSIRCGQYESLFKANNFTGESLLECDQKILSEIGIKKIGDRVRINVAIKQLRNKSSVLRTRRNRDSLAVLDGFVGTPSSSDSPRTHASRSQTGSGKRFSRQKMLVNQMQASLLRCRAFSVTVFDETSVSLLTFGLQSFTKCIVMLVNMQG